MDAGSDWNVGMGYRMESFFAMPLFQRGRAWEGHVCGSGPTTIGLGNSCTPSKQVSIDVDNWLSAQVRARDRVTAATEALRLAKTLEEGELTEFQYGRDHRPLCERP